MSSAESREINSVVQQVQTWSVPMRIALARRILETTEDPGASAIPIERRRGYSAEEVKALLKIDKPGSDDETVKQWIDDHRLEKYGT